MPKEIFKNIVDVYSSVSKSVDENGEADISEFEKVITFCLNDEVCLTENNVKRNLLLFWSFCKLAKAKQKKGKYKEALDVLQKAKKFVVFDADKIKLGNKMLEIITLMKGNIDYKAEQLIEVSYFLRDAYEKRGDIENAAKQYKLQEIAEKLLMNSRLKH